jgi:hypothetical protein
VPSAVYTQTLQRAAKAVGGEARLARALKVPRSQARRWMAGQEEPPVAIYHRALDLLIATGAN